METKLKLDFARHEVIYRQKRITLSPREWTIIGLLMSGKSTSREVLTRTAWKTSENVQSRTVDQSICRLRRILGPKSIRTIRNFGYRLDA